jgi:hypothetical protein
VDPIWLRLRVEFARGFSVPKNLLSPAAALGGFLSLPFPAPALSWTGPSPRSVLLYLPSSHPLLPLSVLIGSPPPPRRLQSLTQCRLPSILGARPCPRRRPTRVEPPTLPPLIPMPSPLLSAPSWPAPSAEKGVVSKSILFRSSFLLTISLPRLGLTLLSSSRCFLFPLQEGPV